MSNSTEQKLKDRTLLGTPGAGGRGVGRPVVVNTEKRVVKPEKIGADRIGDEVELLERALDELVDEFEALKSINDEEDVTDVMETQVQLLRDPELKKSILDKIQEQRFKAVYAIFSSFNEYIQLLENSEMNWLKDRTIDIVSIRDQLIDTVRNKQPDYIHADNGVIFAEELSPTEMIKLSRFNLAGIVMEKGGLTSHVVILAQSLGIPCVIGVDWKRMWPEDFEYVMIDGDVGSVLFEPTDQLKEEVKFYKQEKLKKQKIALQWASEPDETECGCSFAIRGNVEFISELPRVKTHGARGIGLLRTETILFESGGFDVQTQIDFYRQAAEASGEESVIIRLFDAGGDKLPENHEQEHNPFLGWRGIRMLLDKPELLRQQYEAILRVSVEFKGKIKILVPMISHMHQIERAKDILKEVEEELRQSGVGFDPDIPFGIMIEVPGIAVMAKEAAEDVDFFSIGTNDLTQYMLAVDRGNSKISSLYQPSHPSIWRMIKFVTDAAKEAGIPISVCGEMASNPLYAACFLGMGISDLSMTTNSIPAVKKMLCSHTLAEFKEITAQVLQSHTSTEVNLIFDEWKNTLDLHRM